MSIELFSICLMTYRSPERIRWQSLDLDGPYSIYELDPPNSAFAFASSSSDGGEGGGVLTYMSFSGGNVERVVWSIQVEDIKALAIANFFGEGSVAATVEGDQIKFYDAEYENMWSSKQNNHIVLYKYICNYRDFGEPLGEPVSLSTICPQSRLLAEDVDLDGTPDLVASCGDVITILLASDSGGLDLTLGSPPLDSPVVDLALASLDHGRARDVYATTVDQSLWRLDSDTGELENTRIRATGVEHIDGGSHIVNITIYSNTAAPFNFANFFFHLHRPTRQRTEPLTTSGKATPHTPYAGYFIICRKTNVFQLNGTVVLGMHWPIPRAVLRAQARPLLAVGRGPIRLPADRTGPRGT